MYRMENLDVEYFHTMPKYPNVILEQEIFIILNSLICFIAILQTTTYVVIFIWVHKNKVQGLDNY